MTVPPERLSPGPISPPAIRNHRRFALTDVSLDDLPVGGATVDTWQDRGGARYWSARVVMWSRDASAGGDLTGSTRDGRMLRGRVALVGPDPAVRGRGPVLMQWRGVGALQDDEAMGRD